MNVADVLERAADVIDEQGHAKFALKNEQGYCVLGALNMAAYGHYLWTNGHSPELGLAVMRMREFVQAHWLDDWNNELNRTAAEVTSTLRACAAVERARAAAVAETETA